jgi:hypothetical protein
LTLAVIPAIYLIWRRWQLRRQTPIAAREEPLAEPALASFK